MNLVLDDVSEVLRGISPFPHAAAFPSSISHSSSSSPLPFSQTNLFLSTDDEGNESSRQLGLVVARGTLLVLVSPVDGSEEIANPFVQQEE